MLFPPVLAPDLDVIVSSRARLARNVAGHPFPSRASDAELRRIAQAVRQAAHADADHLLDFETVEMATQEARERATLLDAHRISPEIAEGQQHRYALLSKSGSISILINEEDHVRLQAVAPGNAPQAVLQDVQAVEERLGARLTWARNDAAWGYLTASMSNTGTGLRLSVLAHLPALVFLNRLDGVFDAAKRLGVSVRGAQGEHSLGAGDLFQVSNSQTLATTPAPTCARVQAFADLLVRDERAARAALAADATKRHRVLSAAKHAWERVDTAPQLSARDALETLSSLRLCAACGLEPWSRTGQMRPAPDAETFAGLLAGLRTGAGLLERESASELRDAIGRPALLRAVLTPLYSGSV